MTRSNKNINIYRLNEELHYHPSWYKDKTIFFKLLKKSNFTNKEIVEFGRIYVRYSHIKHFKELTKYFNFIIQKMNLGKSEQLFKKTRQIYEIYNSKNFN